MSLENVGLADLVPTPVSAQDPAWGRLRLDEPVVVLTCARSGSTLLRFILDSHPELACPPETGIVDLCTRLGVVAMLLDGPPTGVRTGLTKLAAASIRSWVNVTYATYLARVGKKRWCDKSLGSAESANRFLNLFPQAKFICLYRHCMDVIDSALEASPFGLRGYGMDPFAASHPGNTVAAVADYWVWHTRMITEFEQAHKDACLRVRYEDLVTDPEGEAGRIFEFIGEAPVPEISAACLAPGKEAFGPSDHKIWTTSAITPESVGRGSRIPASNIPPPVLAMVNGLLEQLEYPSADMGAPSVPDRGSRGTAGSVTEATPPPDSAGGIEVLDELDEALADRIGTLRKTCNEESGQSPAPGEPPFVICATVTAGDSELPLARWWRVDPISVSLTRGERHEPVLGPDQWAVTADARTWRSVLSGDVNLATAFRQGYIRYNRNGGTPDSEPTGLPMLRGYPHLAVLAQVLNGPAEETAHAT
jgi:hypothetical protein